MILDPQDIFPYLRGTGSSPDFQDYSPLASDQPRSSRRAHRFSNFTGQTFHHAHGDGAERCTPDGCEYEQNTTTCVSPRVIGTMLAREEKDKNQWFLHYLMGLNPQLWENYLTYQKVLVLLEGKLYHSFPLLFVQNTSNSEPYQVWPFLIHIGKHATHSWYRRFPVTLTPPYCPKLSFSLPDLERPTQGYSYHPIIRPYPPWGTW